MDAIAVVGSVASIIGLVLSIALIIRTGNIQENVSNALKQNAKISAYNKHKHNIIHELTECVQFFLDEHTLEDQKPFIQRMDAALSELKTYHPNLTQEILKDIDTIRESYKNPNGPFGYIVVMRQMNDILAILKQEDTF